MEVKNGTEMGELEKCILDVVERIAKGCDVVFPKTEKFPEFSTTLVKLIEKIYIGDRFKGDVEGKELREVKLNDLEVSCRIGKGIMHLRKGSNAITYRKSQERKRMELSLSIEEGIHIEMIWTSGSEGNIQDTGGSDIGWSIADFVGAYGTLLSVVLY